MLIAIYGGSFNPPHLGHIRVVRSAIENLKPDLFLIIPDNLPPHKSLTEGSPSPEERLALCRVAFSIFPQVQISDMELKRGGKSYTYDTICQLKEQYPDDNLVLIMGRDMFDSFSTWHCPEGIQSLCALYVAPRPIQSESSTEARTDLTSDGWSSQLSEEVNAYIRENHLYSSP